MSGVVAKRWNPRPVPVLASSSSSSLVRLVVASQSNYRHVVGLVCDRICAMEHPWLFYWNVSKQKNLPCETLAITIAKRFRSIAFPCCINQHHEWECGCFGIGSTAQIIYDQRFTLLQGRPDGYQKSSKKITTRTLLEVR